jgi:hypothetical protein
MFCILFGMPSGILSENSSGILLDILSYRYSDIPSGILSDVWHPFWHSFWHVFGSMRAQLHLELTEEKRRRSCTFVKIQTLTWQVGNKSPKSQGAKKPRKQKSQKPYKPQRPRSQTGKNSS